MSVCQTPQTLGLAGYLSPRTNRRFAILDWDGTLNVEWYHFLEANNLELLRGVPRFVPPAGTWRRHRRRGKSVWRGESFLDPTRPDDIHSWLRILLAAEDVELGRIYTCPITQTKVVDVESRRPGLPGKSWLIMELSRRRFCHCGKELRHWLRAGRWDVWENWRGVKTEHAGEGAPSSVVDNPTVPRRY